MKKVLKILLCSIIVLTISGCGNKTAKESQKEYYCENGTLKDGVCELVETEEVTKTCEEGYNLTDGKCVKTTTTNAKATNSCSSGYTLNGSNCLGQQVDKIAESYCVQSYTQYEKSNGLYYKALRVENSACLIRICRKGPDEDCYDTYAEAKYRLVCPSGTKEVNGKCYKTSNVKTTYTCETGTLNGSKCTLTDTKEAINTCKTEGYTYNTESMQCEKITTNKALEK